jgi:hypothetical protein
MGKFECTVCALPVADKAAVESKINAGAKFRELARLCGISKSSLHRHSVNCMPRNRLRELKNRRLAPAAESRQIVLWPDEPFDVAQMKPEDFLIVVQYAAAVPPREYGKFDGTEEVSESVAADDTFSDVTPCEVGDRQGAEVENRNYPIIVKSECEHVWRDVAASVTRREKCGEQKPVHGFGISRAEYEEHRGRSAFRGIFGRFAR